MCFCVIYVLFRVRTTIYIFSIIFRKKTRNSLFPQWKTGIIPVTYKIELWSLHVAGGFGYDGSKRVNAIFIPWPEVTTHTDNTFTTCNSGSNAAYKLEQSTTGEKMIVFLCHLHLHSGANQKFVHFWKLFFEKKKRNIFYSRNVKLRSTITVQKKCFGRIVWV